MSKYRFLLLDTAGKNGTIYVDIDAENENDAFEAILEEYGKRYYITKYILIDSKIR
jgi:hypothetical protein